MMTLYPMHSKSLPPKWRSFTRYLQELSKGQGLSEEAPPSESRFFNRELSWMRFNDRVLAEAADPRVPALERLRFATIVSTNLDEFFMVRVAEVARHAKRLRGRHFNTPFHPTRILALIRAHVIQQKERQAEVLKDIFRALAGHGIHIFSDFKAFEELDRDIMDKLPDLNFILRRYGEPLPHLRGNRIHIFIRFAKEYAVVSLEHRSDRLLHLSDHAAGRRHVLLDRWIAARAQSFFPSREVLEAFCFKIIRDADLQYSRMDSGDLEEQIEEAIDRRAKARVVRLEVDGPSYSEGSLYLATMLGLDSAALYSFNLPLDLKTLMQVYRAEETVKLKYPSIVPVVPPALSNPEDSFRSIRNQDMLLHHPYDSFQVIVDFIDRSAEDPDVTAIYHALYRTSSESPIMRALMRAAKAGKKVVVYIEIKARFDELNNLRWARELKKAGCRVIRPMGLYKVHSKLTQVVRSENGSGVYYTHLGTGNYHPDTALQYTDLGLLTADPDLGNEVAAYFAWLTKGEKPNMAFKDILVAPQDLDHQFLKLIREETRIQRSGGQGEILAKMNSLVDDRIIESLYEASQAGVQIRLVVRGICCLRPGMKGLSENIEVKSVVDRFLEHSRIYYFRAGGQHKLYLSSADLMPRNFNSRYEIAFAVKDPDLKSFIRDVILATSLADNVKSWRLSADGTYIRITPAPGEKPVRSQKFFEELASKRYEGTALGGRRPKVLAAAVGEED